jgi:hypothetical protein
VVAVADDDTVDVEKYDVDLYAVGCDVPSPE